MKKFESFGNIINYLDTEEIPFKDNKQDILKRLNDKCITKRIAYRKLSIICVALFTLAISVALNFGYIKEHEEYVKAHSGKIKSLLFDDRGNIVIQMGVVGDEYYRTHMQESDQRTIISKEYEVIEKSLEDKLPDDKVAVFIPVKGLETFIDFNILNLWEYYYTIEDMKNNIQSHIPMPGYIPDRFAFSKAWVFYKHENFYEPYEDDMTYEEFLTKLFEEAKEEGKDYYYKEYNRSDEVTSYILEYMDYTKTQILQLHFRKGKSTDLHYNGTKEFTTKIIEYNGRKYLENDTSYHTYIYIEDELWTIELNIDPKENGISEIIDSVR